jgi:pimeloyl-ACP methyl ester carboxylesterase
MPTAAVNGTSIAYFDSGGDEPAVVFCHGFLMDHTMFDPQVKVLVPEFRVVTWDERGFGGSPAGGPFSYWDSASDLLGLLDHLELEQAVVGGMSQGGFIALRTALLAPERVRGLVLFDTQAGGEDPTLAASYDLLHATWLENGSGPVQEIVASIILGPGEWPDYFAMWAALDPEQLTLAYRCLMDRDDVTPRLGEITCPALIVHGTDDAAIPFAKAEELRAGLGGQAAVVAIEGGPHASNITHAAAVNPPVVDFVRTTATTTA